MSIYLPSCDVWPQMIQGSEQWFAARRGRATASQFKRIITPTGKISTQADAYARQLARETVMEDPQEFTGNKFTDWGNEHEPEGRQAWSEATGMSVIEIGFATSKEMPVVGCSPDGLVVSKGKVVAGLEIKCPKIDTLVEWSIGGTIPDEHLAQVHGSMLVTGLRTWHFVAYHPGAPPFIPPPATWDGYTDRLASALESFVLRYAEIRPVVLAALGVNESRRKKPQPIEESLI